MKIKSYAGENQVLFWSKSIIMLVSSSVMLEKIESSIVVTKIQEVSIQLEGRERG